MEWSDDEVVRLYVEKELSCAQVGALMGCSGDKVRRRLASLGVPRRPAHQGITAWRVSNNEAYIAVCRAKGKLDGKQEEIKSKYLSGQCASSIAKEYGVSPSTIISHLDKLRVPKRDPCKIPFSAERLAEMYLRENRSLAEIADWSGVAQSSVLRWMKKFNIPRRPSGQGVSIALTQGRGQKPSGWTNTLQLQALEKWRKSNPELVCKHNRKASKLSALARKRNSSRLSYPCGWCGEAVKRYPSQIEASRSRGGSLVFCNTHHRTLYATHKRCRPGTPRPIIVERLRELMTQPGFRVTPGTPHLDMVERVDRAGATIGATEEECSEVLFEK